MNSCCMQRPFGHFVDDIGFWHFTVLTVNIQCNTGPLRVELGSGVCCADVVLLVETTRMSKWDLDILVLAFYSFDSSYCSSGTRTSEHSRLIMELIMGGWCCPEWSCVFYRNRVDVEMYVLVYIILYIILSFLEFGLSFLPMFVFIGRFLWHVCGRRKEMFRSCFLKAHNFNF